MLLQEAILSYINILIGKLTTYFYCLSFPVCHNISKKMYQEAHTSVIEHLFMNTYSS